MNILVTGGAGFIGSHLCDALIAEGHRVVALDNLILGRLENIHHLMDHDGFKFTRGDILDDSLLRNLFKTESFDDIYHLAANSDIQKGHAEPLIDFDFTFRTTFEILQCMREFKVYRLVFTSSSAIYGNLGKVIKENSGPLNPLSLYGAAKLGSEAYISAFSENYGIQAWIVRFPNVVGERATHGVIFDFINKLRMTPSKLEVLGDGNQKKPYLYVKELVQAVLYIRKHANEKLNCFNIGVESQATVREIAKIVTEEMGLSPILEYSGGSKGWVGDVPEYFYDTSKLRNLGWKPSLSSIETIRLSVRELLSWMSCLTR